MYLLALSCPYVAAHYFFGAGLLGGWQCCLSALFLAVIPHSRTILSSHIQFMARLLVPPHEVVVNNSDLRSQTGLVLLKLADKYGIAATQVT